MIRRRLNDYEKAYIVTNYNNMRLVDIAKYLGKRLSTIQSFYNRYLERGYFRNHKSYNKLKLRDLDIKEVEKEINSSKEITLQQLIDKLKLNCHPQTLKRYLRKNKIRYLNVPYKAKIREQDKKQRIKFAEKYKNWAINDWKNVLFCDECSVVVGRTNRKRIWKKVGERRFETKPRIFSYKYFKVFSFIMYDKIGDLHILDEKWSSKTYIKILKLNIEPAIHQNNKYFLLQDNDTCHTSNKTCEFINSIGLKLIDFPPNSSDLNPIENAWYILKKKLSKFRSLNIEKVKEKARQIWRETSIDYIKKLVESMPRRIESVILNKGDITKY